MTSCRFCTSTSDDNQSNKIERTVEGIGEFLGARGKLESTRNPRNYEQLLTSSVESKLGRSRSVGGD